METLVNDKILQERNIGESDVPTPAPSTSTDSGDSVKRRQLTQKLNVSGPVKSYSTRLKNFWYPVAFSTDLKDDTMVTLLYESLSFVSFTQFLFLFDD